MAAIRWRETAQNAIGNKAWIGDGPYHNINEHWEIVCKPEIITGDLLYYLFAGPELGGDGYGDVALAIDYFLSLDEAKAFAQGMHDEAICGSSD